MTLQFTVPSDFDGQRLDRFLVSVLAEHSRSQIQKLIADGHVTSSARRPSRRTRPRPKPTSRCARATRWRSTSRRRRRPTLAERGAAARDPVSGRRPRRAEQAGGHGRASRAPGHASGTLVNALLHHLDDLSGIGGELRPGIVHRLDRGTSGVMVVAKNDAAHQELARQFQDREVEKEYIALVWGVVQAGRRIDAAIGRDPVQPAEDVGAREARARPR